MERVGWDAWSPDESGRRSVPCGLSGGARQRALGPAPARGRRSGPPCAGPAFWAALRGAGVLGRPAPSGLGLPVWAFRSGPSGLGLPVWAGPGRPFGAGPGRPVCAGPGRPFGARRLNRPRNQLPPTSGGHPGRETHRSDGGQPKRRPLCRPAGARRSVQSCGADQLGLVGRFSRVAPTSWGSPPPARRPPPISWGSPPPARRPPPPPARRPPPPPARRRRRRLAA